MAIGVNLIELEHGETAERQTKFINVFQSRWKELKR